MAKLSSKKSPLQFTERLTIELTPEQKKELINYCTRDGVSMSFLMRRLISWFLSEYSKPVKKAANAKK
jgi:hypothetical protein